MLSNINQAASDNVFELTGPGVLNRALGRLNVATTPYRLTCYQGSFTNEFFQYVDHPQGKWVHVQAKIPAVRNGACAGSSDR